MKYTFLVLFAMSFIPDTQKPCMDARGICTGNICYCSCTVKNEKSCIPIQQNKQHITSSPTQQNIKEWKILKEVNLYMYQRWLQ